MNTKRTIERDGNRYCGPLVLAAIMGCTTAEAAHRVRCTHAARGCHVAAVKGMANWELRETLSRYGWLAVDEPVPYRIVRVPVKFGSKEKRNKQTGPTLAEWLRLRKDRSATHVVVLSDHYILVKGRKCVDTFTNGEWVWISKSPHRRKRIKRVFRIERAQRAAA